MAGPVAGRKNLSIKPVHFPPIDLLLATHLSDVTMEIQARERKAEMILQQHDNSILKLTAKSHALML